MGKITFIIGGARSGKSSYAVELAKKSGKRVAFIATCLPLDGEMKKRIANHRKRRPKSWKIFEEPLDICRALKQIGRTFEIVIIDCLTLFVSNLMLEGFSDRAIENKIKDTLERLKSIKCDSIIVSNEAGSGVVPDNTLARRFRDIGGRTNQLAALHARQVFFMVSGLPMTVKGRT